MRRSPTLASSFSVGTLVARFMARALASAKVSYVHFWFRCSQWRILHFLKKLATLFHGQGGIAKYCDTKRQFVLVEALEKPSLAKERTDLSSEHEPPSP
jgi:hypothetical protein